MDIGSTSHEGDAGTEPEHVPWWRRPEPGYDALPSEPIAVHELAVDGREWDEWAQSAREASTRSKQLSGIASAIVTLLLVLLGLIVLPGASKSLVVCTVPLFSWGIWRIVRDLVLRRSFADVAHAMRTRTVPELFKSVTDLEFLRIAGTGAGPVVGDSKFVRVKQRSDDALIVAAEYDLELWNIWDGNYTAASGWG